MLSSSSRVLQRMVYPNMAAMWAAVHPAFNVQHIQDDSVLNSLYNDAAARLGECDFVHTPGQAPQITWRPSPPAPTPYLVAWDSPANLQMDADYYSGAIIHELAHAAASRMYDRSGANQGDLIWGNINLPTPIGPVNPANGLAANQQAALLNQMQTLDDNWTDLENELAADNNAGTIVGAEHAHIGGRIQYALVTQYVHNETVLADVMYYLRAKGLDDSRTYRFARRMLKEANDRRRRGWWSWSWPGEQVRRVDSRAAWYELLKW
jgi:hypothetical protein